MLIYLFWEEHSFGDLPFQAELDGRLFQIRKGWIGKLDHPLEWIELPENVILSLENALETANYWKWEKDYSDPDILDGTTWSIKIRAGKTGNRKKNCFGINRYPDDYGEIESEIRKLEKLYSLS